MTRKTTLRTFLYESPLVHNKILRQCNRAKNQNSFVWHKDLRKQSELTLQAQGMQFVKNAHPPHGFIYLLKIEKPKKTILLFEKDLRMSWFNWRKGSRMQLCLRNPNRKEGKALNFSNLGWIQFVIILSIILHFGCLTKSSNLPLAMFRGGNNVCSWPFSRKTPSTHIYDYKDSERKPWLRDGEDASSDETYPVHVPHL